jgi:hypothetical protein
MLDNLRYCLLNGGHPVVIMQPDNQVVYANPLAK